MLGNVGQHLRSDYMILQTSEKLIRYRKTRLEFIQPIKIIFEYYYYKIIIKLLYNRRLTKYLFISRNLFHFLELKGYLNKIRVCLLKINHLILNRSY